MKKLIYSTALIIMIMSFSLHAQHKQDFPFKTKLMQKMDVLEKEIQDQTENSMYKYSEKIGNPANSKDFWWTLATWVLLTNTVYSYNDDGFQIEEIRYDAFSGSPSTKINIAFDEHKNQTQMTNSLWNEEQWEISYGTNIEYEYTPTDKIAQTTYQFWDGVELDWKNQDRVTNTFNNDDKIIERVFYAFFTGSWLENDRDLYELNVMNEWSTVTSFIYYNNDWYESERVTNIAWLNFEERKLLSALRQVSTGSDWLDDELVTVTYDGDNFIRLIELYADNTWTPNERETFIRYLNEDVTLSEFFSTDEWENSNQETDYYDSHGTYQGTKSEYWDSGDKKNGKDGWMTEYFIFTDYSYNEEGFIVEAVGQYWDFLTDSLVNSWKSEYSNFGSSDILESGAFAGMKVFPNPVEDLLVVKSPDAHLNDIYYRLVDLSGKIMLQGSLEADQTTLNLTNLPSGLYLLDVSNDESQQSLKVQKK